MKTLHTEEPWEILPEEKDATYIRIRGTQLGRRYKIANVLSPHKLEGFEQEAAETRANAERIVACVNACRGIDTEQLWIMLDADETFDFCYKRLKAQRDEIIEASNDMLERYAELDDSGDCDFWTPERDPLVVALRAAIAKAEGE